MTASWSGPHTGSTEYKRGSRIDRGQWQAPLGSSRGQPPDRRQPAAVLASGGAEETLSLTAAARDGDGNMPSGRKNARGAGRTKEWNDMTKDNKSRVMLPLTKTAPYKPDAGNPHVRFDERGRKTERTLTRHRALPRLYRSTDASAMRSSTPTGVASCSNRTRRASKIAMVADRL